MSKTTRIMTGMLMAAGLLTAGCGTSEEGGSAASCDPASTELRFGIHAEPRGFDVTQGGSVGVQGGTERAAIFDTLIEYDAEAAEYRPRMAESMEPNEDFSQWTLKLREGINFASGNPVTTEAVKFSVDRHGAEDTVSLYKPQMDNIESMEITGPLEMVFHLSAPRGDFPMVFASAPGMLADPAVFKEKGAEKFGLDPGDGAAGPYQVASYTPGEEILLKKRDDYWGEGDYCIGTLRFVHIQSEETRRDAFLNAELDAVFLQASSVINDVREGGDYDEHMSYSWGDSTVLINHGTGSTERPGEDPRVRKAIAYALDTKVIDERATGGVGIPSSALVTEKSGLWSEGLEGPPYDPDQARSLLAEAKADGYDGKITLSCEKAPAKVEWAIVVEAMLESVGFEVEVDNQRDITDFVLNVYYPGNYDIACFPLGIDEAQPWATYQNTMGEDVIAQSRVGYQSDEMTAAMDALRIAGNIEEQQVAMQQIQEVWNADIPLAITGHSQRGVFWQDGVEGVRFMNTAIALFDDARLAR